MADRQERARQAARHTGLMKNVYGADIDATIQSAAIYEDGDGRELAVPEPAFESTHTTVTTDFASKALYGTQGKAVIIDAGAFNHPAGNYETGAFGPEQTLCADSDLYPVLCGLKESYYEKNHGWESGQLFSDRALYLKDVVFSSNGEPRRADVVVIAAPNRTHALENHRSPEGCDQALEFRIEAALRVASQGGAETLIMGAFGCGVLGNSDEKVTGLVKTWLDAHPGVFKTVVFAVPRGSYRAFEAVFGHDEPKVEKKAEEDKKPEDGDDGDDEGWRDIELPEGVTLG